MIKEDLHEMRKNEMRKKGDFYTRDNIIYYLPLGCTAEIDDYMKDMLKQHIVMYYYNQQKE